MLNLLHYAVNCLLIAERLLVNSRIIARRPIKRGAIELSGKFFRVLLIDKLVVEGECTAVGLNLNEG